MLFIGFLEAFALSWFFKREDRIKAVGSSACNWFDSLFFTAVWGSSIAFCLMMYGSTKVDIVPRCLGALAI